VLHPVRHVRARVYRQPLHQQAAQRGQGVDLDLRPDALLETVVEADPAPPLAVDEDRDEHDRADVPRLELAPLDLGEVADDAVQDVAA